MFQHFYISPAHCHKYVIIKNSHKDIVQKYDEPKEGAGKTSIMYSAECKKQQLICRMKWQHFSQNSNTFHASKVLPFHSTNLFAFSRVLPFHFMKVLPFPSI